jgi:hypothetical protein
MSWRYLSQVGAVTRNFTVGGADECASRNTNNLSAFTQVELPTSLIVVGSDELLASTNSLGASPTHIVVK